ncbi:MAG: Rab5-interacting family protein [Alphaproteobacteria bacterium]|nr:Rab5-interacting family protein [Alphaproteobacteria bacterium]
MLVWLRAVLHWILLAAGILTGLTIGILALRSMVWAVAFAVVGALIAAIFLNTRSVRNAAVTFITIFICLLVGEGVIAYSNRPAPPPANGGPPTPVASELPTFDPQPLFVADPALGWKLRPASVIHAVRARGEHIIYDATYTIDPRGQRVTPDSNPDGETVLFMGDSFMFGDGLPDTDTVPQRFAVKTGRRFNVVNLGVSAYGPHQVLRQIEEGVVDRAIAGKGKVRAVFLYFNDDQLPRAAGDKNQEWWWKVAPQYERTDDGVRLIGTAAEVWDRRGSIERAVSEAVRSSVIAPHVRRIVRVYPQLMLSEALVKRIRQHVRERYGAELVVIYWSKDPSRFYPTTISWMIERTGAQLMFIPDVMPAAGLALENALIPEDGHPNGRLNDAIAAALATRYIH